MSSKLANIIEAIIFVAEQPVKIDFLREVLATGSQTQVEIDFEQEEQNGKDVRPQGTEPISDEQINEALTLVLNKYQSIEYPFEIRQISGGYQFYTKKEYYPYVRWATLIDKKKRLSRVVMETLSIMAYRQPITKAELEFIRGVNCDYAVQKLLDKQLVSIVGRSDAPGRPLLYATSPFFMQYFGLASMEDLPKLKEFEELAEEHLDAFRMNQERDALTNTETEETEADGQEITETSSLLGTEESRQTQAEEKPTLPKQNEEPGEENFKESEEPKE